MIDDRLSFQIKIGGRGYYVGQLFVKVIIDNSITHSGEDGSDDGRKTLSNK